MLLQFTLRVISHFTSTVLSIDDFVKILSRRVEDIAWPQFFSLHGLTDSVKILQLKPLLLIFYSTYFGKWFFLLNPWLSCGRRPNYCSFEVLFASNNLHLLHYLPVAISLEVNTFDSKRYDKAKWIELLSNGSGTGCKFRFYIQFIFVCVRANYHVK